MEKNIKKAFTLLLMFILCLSLAGCRIRDFFLANGISIFFWGYVLFFLVLGTFILLKTRIFGRTRIARVKQVQNDDGQDINTRSFLSVPAGGARSMGRTTNPMNEEFLNTRKILFALVDQNDKLLVLRARNLPPNSLKSGQYYRIEYKGNMLKKIEQIPGDEI